METNGIGKERIWFIDIARFYAMFLVFYTHFIEEIVKLGNPAAAGQYKFVNAFHMMLFFILAGFVFKETYTELSFGKFMKQRFFSRLLPFIFFTVIFMIVAAIFARPFMGDIKIPSVMGYLSGLIITIIGIPIFCIPSWFVLMLFSVEFIHYIVFRFIRSDLKILIAISCVYIIGYILNWQVHFIDTIKQRMISLFLIHEAAFMYSFYLIGVYLNRKKDLIDKISLKISVPGAIIMFLIAFFTYGFNNGPFYINYFNTTVIVLSQHGNALWFAITALSGSFFVMLLAKFTPRRKTMIWIGQNTLILMFLNGVFYHYLNAIGAKWVIDNLSGSALSILIAGLIMTVASLVVCLPVIYLLNRYVPQLVGKPKINGPWIKNLI